jgi:hypothetical protein
MQKRGIFDEKITFSSIIFCFGVLSIREYHYYWLKAVVGQVKNAWTLVGEVYDDDSDFGVKYGFGGVGK